MLRSDTLRGIFLLLCTVPVTMANSFLASPGVVRGDVTGSAALEWTLESEPGRYDLVGFTFNGDDVFRYEPYTGAIAWPVVDGPSGTMRNVTYDPRFKIYNTSTQGVGFRLAGLRPEDAGNYSCIYESLSPAITMDAVLFVCDVPGRPVIEVSPQILVEGVTTVSLECGAPSTSLPVVHRPPMLYTWSRNGVEIHRTAPPERHAVLGDSGQILEISPVHHTDIVYTRAASENGTQLTSEETEVTMDVLHKPYNLTLNLRHPSARGTEVLEITMSADCNPVCSFAWSRTCGCFRKDSDFLRFDMFPSQDATNCIVRADDTTNCTVRAENDFGTVEVGVYIALVTKPEDREADCDVITIVLATIAGVSLTVNVLLFAVGFRRGLFTCRHGGTTPSNQAAVYVNSEPVTEPGRTAADYANSDKAYEEVIPRPREPAHLASMVRECGLDNVPVTSGDHPGAGGVYELVDQRTREPVRPADKVYAALSNTST